MNLCDSPWRDKQISLCRADQDVLRGGQKKSCGSQGSSASYPIQSTTQRSSQSSIPSGHASAGSSPRPLPPSPSREKARDVRIANDVILVFTVMPSRPFSYSCNVLLLTGLSTLAAAGVHRDSGRARMDSEFRRWGGSRKGPKVAGNYYFHLTNSIVDTAPARIGGSFG